MIISFSLLSLKLFYVFDIAIKVLFPYDIWYVFILFFLYIFRFPYEYKKKEREQILKSCHYYTSQH